MEQDFLETFILEAEEIIKNKTIPDCELIQFTFLNHNTLKDLLNLGNKFEFAKKEDDGLEYYHLYLKTILNKAKLHVSEYKKQMALAKAGASSNTNSLQNTSTATATATATVNFTFKQVIERVKNSSDFNKEEINEIVKKITELENLLKDSKTNKKEKWNTAKNTIKFLVDKGFDAGIALLPFFLALA